MIVDEHNQQKQQVREDALTSAYLTAYWQRVKRLPSLEKVLEDIKPKNQSQAPQTPEQMLRAVKRLQAKFEREGE